MNAPQPINHGTYGGAQTHQRRGEEACDECKAARAEYMRKHRQRPDSTHLPRQHAADRARRELARRYPDEYGHLYAAELRKALGQPRLDAEVVAS